MTNKKSIIIVKEGKRSGQACIRSLRMTVVDILGYMAAGMSVEGVLGDFYNLEDEDIRTALASAVTKLKEKKFI